MADTPKLDMCTSLARNTQHHSFSEGLFQPVTRKLNSMQHHRNSQGAVYQRHIVRVRIASLH